ncbi:HGGxSTG domain-containing protein [Lysobacter soli]|uniref:HGGxSTG domain-containing protein n=1 Tax=Lysobacter soli TaxID=453783 RepID=UPI0036AC341E
MRRIDYAPSKGALALIERFRGQQPRGSIAGTNSAVLDAIVMEWGALTGTNNLSLSAAKSSEELAGINRHGARAYEFDVTTLQKLNLAVPQRVLPRVVCGAHRHRDGQPCRAKSEPGKRRCRFHGGRSTGPRTPEGRARALANLRQGKVPCHQAGRRT